MLLLENINNLPPKQLPVNVSFIANKDEEPKESSEDNPSAKTLKNNSLPTESNILMVEDSLPLKWSKKHS